MGRPRARAQWLRRSAFTAAVAITVFCFSAEIALVATPSMEETVMVGDHLLIDKLLYGPTIPLTRLRFPVIRQVHRGDLVSVRSPLSPGTTLLKRAVAVGGDELEIRGATVYVNGSALREPYARYERWNIGNSDLRPFRVPANSIFVMGDNRDNSEDSRAFGVLAAENVIGEPVLICWSFANSWSEWLDAKGNVRQSAYWMVVANLRAKVRWARSGKIL